MICNEADVRVEVDDREGTLMTDDGYGNDGKESGTAMQTEPTLGLVLDIVPIQELQTYQETACQKTSISVE